MGEKRGEEEEIAGLHRHCESGGRNLAIADLPLAALPVRHRVGVLFMEHVPGRVQERVRVCVWVCQGS